MSDLAQCCPPCPSVTVNTPGPPGTNGAAGTPGTNGINAFTITTANFTLPAVNSNVTASVANSSWAAIGQIVVAGDGTNFGTFKVVSLPTTTSVQLQFLGYSGDSAPGIAIVSGATVSPGGLRGPTSLITVTEIFTGTVSFTPQANAIALFVECIGGGASGGGVGTAATNAGGGGGGGAGAYSCVFLNTVLANYTVAVGAGGVAGGAGANPGNAGGDTTFVNPTGPTTLCQAKGGAAGGADTVGAGPRVAGAGGAGGASGSGIGDATFDGNPGYYGIALAAAQAVSGRGGGGPFGGSGASAIAQGAGNAGGKFGSGGSGGCILSGGASVAGGAGANGLIRVWQYT